MQLVDEVLGVAADALAKLRELGLELNDGPRAGDGGTGVRGLEGRAVGTLGVDAVEREVFVVPSTHGRLEALDERSLVAQSAGLAGGDLGAVDSRSVGVSRRNSSVGSRARESAV